MGKINWFKDYLQEIQDHIDPINFNRMVVDDSQMTKYMENVDKGKNLLMFGVLPDFASNGSNGDQMMLTASTQLLIVEKTSYSEVNYDEYFNIFEKTHNAAELVIKKLLNDHLTAGCDYLRFLKPETIQCLAVWNKAGCNGWNVIFNFDNGL